jgi:hypothetical protein
MLYAEKTGEQTENIEQETTASAPPPQRERMDPQEVRFSVF